MERLVSTVSRVQEWGLPQPLLPLSPRLSPPGLLAQILTRPQLAPTPLNLGGAPFPSPQTSVSQMRCLASGSCLPKEMWVAFSLQTLSLPLALPPWCLRH